MANVRKWLLAILFAQPFYYEEIRMVHAMLSAARVWLLLIPRTRTGHNNPP